MADQPSPRRRFQFRLMLALLLMTLACVIAAVIGKWMEQAQNDSQSHRGPSPAQNTPTQP